MASNSRCNPVIITTIRKSAVSRVNQSGNNLIEAFCSFSQSRIVYQPVLSFETARLPFIIRKQPVRADRGEINFVPAPRTLHQELVGKIYRKVAEFIYDNNLGKVLIAPTDVLLSKTEKPQPDILFVSTERLNIITEMNVQGAPDLVVEILSPSTGKNDILSHRR